MNHAAIDAYVERSLGLIEADPQMDEENTKAKLIHPLIDLLGWEIYSTAVELEYGMQIGTGHKKVDYALMLEETPVVFIEAKGCDTSLTDSHRSQLRSYMRVAGVNWGLLTNGKSFELLKTKPDAARPTEVTLATVGLADLSTQDDILRLLSHEAIQSGESESVARELEKTQQSIRTLRDEKDAIAEDVAQVVFDTIGEMKHHQVETEAKAFVDRLIAAFQGGLEEDDAPKGSPQESTASPAGDAIAGKIRRSALEGAGDELVAVFPTRESGISFLKENNAWGFVRIGRTPEWVAMYLTRTAKEVRYVARVKDIVQPAEAPLARPLSAYDGDQAAFDESKQVILFEPNSLYELEDPIPFETRYPQSLQYTTLDALRTATTTDELI
ncbi:type I restriction enzyme HsdR N-terminal domain-containing protein [Haladaptatus sp. DYSN1]|uniref:type I restriction enzyme HsdR N-terminal domain-containing protein n=1 Tax=unclassified Haladaptatus TaxID=2622732 RepID=UPI0024050C3C|nr:type I restriction enzyme HsdR N-terminal domain-containing protein [Haladaptatus sp. DYSN1]